MGPFEFPRALLAILGFVLVTPVWVFFTTQYDPVATGTPLSFQVLLGLSLPLALLLLVGSWVQPR